MGDNFNLAEKPYLLLSNWHKEYETYNSKQNVLLPTEVLKKLNKGLVLKVIDKEIVSRKNIPLYKQNIYVAEVCTTKTLLKGIKNNLRKSLKNIKEFLNFAFTTLYIFLIVSGILLIIKGFI